MWQKALKTTKIIRPRVKPLFTDKETELGYTFLAESKINKGDTLVRNGKIIVQKPQLLLPYQVPLFEDFDFDSGMGFSEDSVVNFFLVRGIHFPSYKYKSEVATLEIFEGGLTKALNKYQKKLQKEEDVHTGLVVGDEESWQFSVLILVADVISKGTGEDIKKMMDDLWKGK